VIHQQGVAGAIVGVRSEAEAKELAGVAGVSLGPEELLELATAAP
jgi:aryl-alcohol dehydrogenase-like predicted oxidoreductase